jgi:hypothetical protein
MSSWMSRKIRPYAETRRRGGVGKRASERNICVERVITMLRGRERQLLHQTRKSAGAGLAHRMRTPARAKVISVPEWEEGVVPLPSAHSEKYYLILPHLGGKAEERGDENAKKAKDTKKPRRTSRIGRPSAPDQRYDRRARSTETRFLLHICMRITRSRTGERNKAG